MQVPYEPVALVTLEGTANSFLVNLASYNYLGLSHRDRALQSPGTPPGP